MNRMKKLVAVALSAVTVAGVAVGSGCFSVGASGTGAGLAEYALNAYYEGWSYVWGGTSPGAVDCSGLIWSYCGGDRMEMLADAQANGRDWGYVSNGIPRVHGLGLSRPNHVGVYIEDGMEVDARGSDYGVCYQMIGENGWNNWNCWFKLTAVTYPDYGWENFNGNYYYYEDGEYIVNTSRTIDGTTYYFDSKGHSSTTPSNTSSSSSSSSSTDSSSSNSSSSKSKPTMWSKGSNDEEVVKIQERLAELGYYDGPIDGDFGDATEAAFKAFQTNAGLTPDGIAGADREVLYSDNAPAAKKDKDDKDDKDDAKKDDDIDSEEEPTVAATQPEEEEPEATEPEEEPTVAVTEPEEEEPTTTAVVAASNDDDEDDDEPKSSTPVIIAENGDFNDQVSKIQIKLTELGYYSMDTSGIFGDYTEEAVKDFQIANGIDATGKVDAKTFEVMFSDDAIENVLKEVAPEEKAAPVAAAPKEETVQEAAIPVIEADIPAQTEAAAEAEAPAEEIAPVGNIPDSNTAAIAVPEPTKPGALSSANNNSSTNSRVTKPNNAYAAAASKTAAKANDVTSKTLESATAAATASKTVDNKLFANMWLWLLLAAAVLGVVAFILLMFSRKQTSTPAPKKRTTKAKLNDRW